MTAELDTLLTALYVLIDDHVISSSGPGPGRPKKLSDAELVCLAVAQVLLGARSEHHWLRLCCGRLGHLFPYLPEQPGYHKRVKAAGPLLAAVLGYLARECPSWHDQVRHGRRDEAPRHGSIGWIRQWIEPVSDTLKGQLDLERHGGRTTGGICARIAQRLLAMAACIWHNWQISAEDKRSLIAYDH